MLLLLPFFHLEPGVCLRIHTELQRFALIAGNVADQLAVRKYFSGIQHTGFQKFRLRLCGQMLAAWQGVSVALHGKRNGELQRSDAALTVGRVQHRHPYRAGELRFPVPQFPAVEINLSVRLNNAGNVGTVIRHNGLRSFLLCQSQVPSRLICVQGHSF